LVCPVVNPISGIYEDHVKREDSTNLLRQSTLNDQAIISEEGLEQEIQAMHFKKNISQESEFHGKIFGDTQSSFVRSCDGHRDQENA
jgi:hypothetical protein